MRVRDWSISGASRVRPRVGQGPPPPAASRESLAALGWREARVADPTAAYDAGIVLGPTQAPAAIAVETDSNGLPLKLDGSGQRMPVAVGLGIDTVLWAGPPGLPRPTGPGPGQRALTPVATLGESGAFAFLGYARPEDLRYLGSESDRFQSQPRGSGGRFRPGSPAFPGVGPERGFVAPPAPAGEGTRIPATGLAGLAADVTARARALATPRNLAIGGAVVVGAGLLYFLTRRP